MTEITLESLLERRKRLEQDMRDVDVAIRVVTEMRAVGSALAAAKPRQKPKPSEKEKPGKGKSKPKRSRGRKPTSVPTLRMILMGAAQKSGGEISMDAALDAVREAWKMEPVRTSVLAELKRSRFECALRKQGNKKVRVYKAPA